MKTLDILKMGAKKNTGNGYLYNWPAYSNANFATSGWHVPIDSDWLTLIAYVGDSNAGSDALKATGTEHWYTNPTSTNSSGFTAFASGMRIITEGYFAILYSFNAASIGSPLNRFVLTSFENDPGLLGVTNIVGLSVRLVKDSTSLSNGETSTMTDYDGNVYDTICIGTQEWIVQNWKCTALNDGTPIPNVTDQSTWEGLTTPGRCAYNNDESYV